VHDVVVGVVGFHIPQPRSMRILMTRILMTILLASVILYDESARFGDIKCIMIFQQKFSASLKKK